MFQFTRFPSPTLCIQIGMTGHDSSRVSPFGHPRINTLVQLPVAFRRLHALHRLLVPRHPSYALRSFYSNGKYIISRCVVPQHYTTVKEHGTVRPSPPFRAPSDFT